MSQKITPNLWFDGNATEAVDFYVSTFPDSKIISTANYPNSAEEGSADMKRPGAYAKMMQMKKLIIDEF